MKKLKPLCKTLSDKFEELGRYYTHKSSGIDFKLSVATSDEVPGVAIMWDLATVTKVGGAS